MTFRAQRGAPASVHPPLSMIQRSWRARATPDRAGVYVEHLTRDVQPKLERLEGFLGLVLSQRRDGGNVEIVVQTDWASMQAVARFAGPTPDVAVVEPEAKAVLTSFDPTVQHHEVLVSTLAMRATADPSTRSARSG